VRTLTAPPLAFSRKWRFHVTFRELDRDETGDAGLKMLAWTRSVKDSTAATV